MTTEVDVLIIGAGASAAAFAWSLADTRMRILCLEQGDWVNPADYPSTRRDWEVRMDREFSPNPNLRRRRLPSTMTTHRSRCSTSMAWVAARFCMRRIFRARTRRTFASKPWTAWPPASEPEGPLNFVGLTKLQHRVGRVALLAELARRQSTAQGRMDGRRSYPGAQYAMLTPFLRIVHDRGPELGELKVGCLLEQV